MVRGDQLGGKAARAGASALLSVLVVATGWAAEPGASDANQLPAERVRGCGKARALQQRYQAEPARAAEQTEYDTQVTLGLREAFQDTDLLHCNLEIELWPELYDNIAGTNTMTVQSKSDALTQCTFRLRSQYTITSALVNGTTPVTVSAPSSTTRVAALDRMYAMDEVFTLTIAYSGHAESRGFGSIEFTSHGTGDITYSLSEPYYSYTWWPTKDGDWGEPGDNSDKFTLELAVSAADDMVTASNGLLLGIDPLPDNRARYRWSSDYPITPYLVCFSTTNYDTWSQTYTPAAGGSMPVEFYIYPEDNTAANRTAWNKAVDMLYTLRDLYGEYPFVNEKYGIYECEFGGGMEHQTFTAQGTFSESVTVHELGHQWWGDMITCKTWNHIWLNEGFATYTEALWAEFKPGSSGLPALKANMAAKKYTGAGSVYVTDAEVTGLYDIFDGNTSYDKGGWVVHMLRHVLGSDEFFAALAAYRSAFEYSAATTEDFQTVCEQFYPSGDLDWFFGEWIYGEYVPYYTWGWDTVHVGGQDYVLVYIDQTQSTSIQRFTMPIDIVIDGVTYVVFNDHDPEHFVIPVFTAPSSVQLDPDEWILTSGRTVAAFVPGPPTIVATEPAPGEVVEGAASPTQVTITFHTDVSTSSGDYTLVGDAGGVQAVSFSYDSPTNTATLTAASPLPADRYTLSVSDALTAANSGAALDGEVGDALDAGSLPSGEGVAGGAAFVVFDVLCGNLGDGDCDGDVDVIDFAALQACFAGPDEPATAACAAMRFDADTDVDASDFAAFAADLLGP